MPRHRRRRSSNDDIEMAAVKLIYLKSVIIIYTFPLLSTFSINLLKLLTLTDFVLLLQPLPSHLYHAEGVSFAFFLFSRFTTHIRSQITA